MEPILDMTLETNVTKWDNDTGEPMYDTPHLDLTQGSFTRNSASVVRWGTDSRIEQPSPISPGGPLSRQISSLMTLIFIANERYRLEILGSYWVFDTE